VTAVQSFDIINGQSVSSDCCHIGRLFDETNMRRNWISHVIICPQILLLVLFLHHYPGHCCAEDYVDLNRMADFGVEAKTDSISDYLDSVHVSDDVFKKAIELVLRLGDDNYQTREQTAKQLLTIPKLPPTILDQIAEVEDLELRWRAEKIFAQSARIQGDLFYSVMKVIAERQVAGLARKIVSAMPQFADKRFDDVTRRALLATYSQVDKAFFKKSLLNSEARIRIAAVHVLVEKEKDSAVNLIQPLLSDASDSVRLFTAKSLANAGHHASLQPLVALLDSDQIAIRSQAANILRSVTQQRFDYVAYGENDDRAVAVSSWSKWVSDADERTRLFFPLKDSMLYTGKILVCNYSKHFIYVMNEDGKELWRKEGISEPFGLDVLANGNRLVAACTGKFVAEYDVAGKEIWKVGNIAGNPLSVQRLSNGRTLVSTGGAGKAIEFGSDGEVKAEITVGGFVADAVRLPNGRTLVARYRAGTVAEVDRAGKILWEIGGFKSTRGARRLPNGNTLVTDNGNRRVVECNREGEIVWEVGDLNGPFDSWRLGDGRTLISESNGVRMVDQKGEMLWKHAILNSSRIFAF